MLNQAIIDKIESIDSVDAFKETMNIYMTSNAEQSLKDEAIRELKARKSVYDPTPLHTQEEVFEDIKAGAADIDDLG